MSTSPSRISPARAHHAPDLPRPPEYDETHVVFPRNGRSASVRTAREKLVGPGHAESWTVNCRWVPGSRSRRSTRPSTGRPPRRTKARSWAQCRQVWGWDGKFVVFGRVVCFRDDSQPSMAVWHAGGCVRIVLAGQIVSWRGRRNREDSRPWLRAGCQIICRWARPRVSTGFSRRDRCACRSTGEAGAAAAGTTGRVLRADSVTELAFALVPYHPDGQPPGTSAEQAKLIDEYLGDSSGGARDWSVCTECGMGRVERSDVPRLLDLHREIVAGNR